MTDQPQTPANKSEWYRDRSLATLGDLRRALADYPDEAPVFAAFVSGLNNGTEYPMPRKIDCVYKDEILDHQLNDWQGKALILVCSMNKVCLY